jgi:hypothetical protein
MKKVLLIAGGGLLLLIGIATSSKNGSAPQPTSQPEQKQEVVQASPTPKLEYEILARVEDKADENISVLIKAGETNPKGIAEEVQKSCKKKCNVTLFDDKKAYELDSEYTNKMMSYDVTVAQREAWKKKNTVFLADHLVATVGYSFGDYSEYPMKDWYYKELKGEK